MFWSGLVLALVCFYATLGVLEQTRMTSKTPASLSIKLFRFLLDTSGWIYAAGWSTTSATSFPNWIPPLAFSSWGISIGPPLSSTCCRWSVTTPWFSETTLQTVASSAEPTAAASSRTIRRAGFVSRRRRWNLASPASFQTPRWCLMCVTLVTVIMMSWRRSREWVTRKTFTADECFSFKF